MKKIVLTSLCCAAFSVQAETGYPQPVPADLVQSMGQATTAIIPAPASNTLPKSTVMPTHEVTPPVLQVIPVKPKVTRKPGESQGKGPEAITLDGKQVYSLSTVYQNTLIFPEPYTQLVFDDDTVPIEQPTYLANNRVALLRFKDGANKPVHLVVPLASGRLLDMYLKPERKAGVTVRIENAKLPGEASSDSAAPEIKGNHSIDRERPGTGDCQAPGCAAIPVLEAVLQGKLPEEYTAAPLGSDWRFKEFDALAVSHYSNSDLSVRTYRLVLREGGPTSVNIDPALFWRPGVLSSMVSEYQISPTQSPVVVIVEEISHE